MTTYRAVRKGRCVRCQQATTVGQLVSTTTTGGVVQTVHAGVCPPARVERGRGPTPRPEGAPGPSLTADLAAALHAAAAGARP